MTIRFLHQGPRKTRAVFNGWRIGVIVRKESAYRRIPVRPAVQVAFRLSPSGPAWPPEQEKFACVDRPRNWKYIGDISVGLNWIFAWQGVAGTCSQCVPTVRG